MDGPAMVQMIENWSAVDAVALGAPRAADLSGFAAIDLRVGVVQPVAGFPNLLAEATGGTLTILAPAERLAGLAEGAQLRLRLRRAPGRVFADPAAIERR